MDSYAVLCTLKLRLFIFSLLFFHQLFFFALVYKQREQEKKMKNKKADRIHLAGN